MVVHYGISEQPAAVGRWSQTLEELHGGIAHCFARSEVRERSRRPTALSDGLLGQFGEQGTSAQPLDQRQPDLRLVAQRCGEAEFSCSAL